MIKWKSLVVFDVDWVILDTAPKMIEGVKQVCIQMWLNKDESFYREHASNSKLPEFLFPNDINKQKQAEEIYLSTFDESDDTPSLIEWVPEVLDKILSLDKKIAFLSWKIKADIDRAMTEHGLIDIASHIYWRNCLNNLKPHPEWLIKLMELTNLRSNKLVMIWDDIRDMQCAENAKVDFIWVDSWVNTPDKWDELDSIHISSVKGLI